jgi:hypothetical protein
MSFFTWLIYITAAITVFIFCTEISLHDRDSGEIVCLAECCVWYRLDWSATKLKSPSPRNEPTASGILLRLFYTYVGPLTPKNCSKLLAPSVFCPVIITVSTSYFGSIYIFVMLRFT